MKKILAVIDGLKYSKSTTQYAVQVARQMTAHLVGVFLEDFTYHSYKIYELVGDQGVQVEKRARLEAEDKEKRAQAIASFEMECREAGINYSIHRDRNIALQELLHESVYADLLVINCEETFTHYEEAPPTRFIRNLLTQVQCAVLLVPPDYKPFEKLVLLYDGQPNSVYAIKMFSYLMPSMRQLSTEVVSVKTTHQSLHLPDNHLIKEYMKRHFPHAVYTVLQGEAEAAIVDHVTDDGVDVLIVLGAYQRGMVSRLFRASMADSLVRDLSAPLFIAHSR